MLDFTKKILYNKSNEKLEVSKIRLDYTLKTPEERLKLVEQILEETPNPNEAYLEILADYLILCMEKQEKKQKQILTDNRMATVGKRECSFENLVSQLENGEDGIYNLINENKHQIFNPKKTITQKDIEEIPPLKQLRQTIQSWEQKLARAQGRDVFIIKRALIEMRKDQYIIKNAYRCPVNILTFAPQRAPILFEEPTPTFDAKGYPKPHGISLMRPEVCSAILCNYSELKQNGEGNFEDDTFYLMLDFDNISERALAPFPLYERLVTLKIDGLKNTEIQSILLEEFGVKHSFEYISSLWRNKIPKLIALEAENQYLSWYYFEKEKGAYKKCNRCGQIKLAHNKYFSKNKSSKDGYYSICKCCRNTKKGG